MIQEKRQTDNARVFFYACQVRVNSPKFSEAEILATRMLDRAAKAGCPIAERIDETFGAGRRVATCSWDDAKTVAMYYCKYIETLYTVEFRMKDGQIKKALHRDAKEVERLQNKGVLISVVQE